MIGIPFRILRDSATGPDQEIVYLSTRRSGDVGEKMRRLKREYQSITLEWSKVVKRITFLASAAEKLVADPNSSTTELMTIGEEQDDLGGKAVALEERSLKIAEDLVRTSLQINYGKEGEKVIDRMTDEEVRSCVFAIEKGEAPGDFFPYRDTPLSARPTSQPGVSRAGSSSSKASRAGKSRKGK